MSDFFTILVLIISGGIAPPDVSPASIAPERLTTASTFVIIDPSCPPLRWAPPCQ